MTRILSVFNFLKRVGFAVLFSLCLVAQAQPPVFTTHIVGEYNYPSGLTYGDLDGDGDLDLVAGSWDSNADRLLWYENVGPFDYVEHVIDTLVGALDIAIADLDGDSNKDIVAVGANHGHDQNTVAMWLNDGAQLFSKILLTDTLVLPNGVVAKDFDQDGRTDIVISAEFSDVILFLRNTVDSGFVTQIISQDFPMPIHVQTANVNGDGLLDLFCCSLDGLLAWWEGDGNGEFVYHPIASGMNQPTRMLAADMDNDGDTDFYGTGNPFPEGYFYWVENDGEENFELHYVSVLEDLQQFLPNELCGGDFDGDGDFDVVMCVQPPYDLYYLENDGNMQFEGSALYHGFGLPLLCTDLDFDGDDDLALCDDLNSQVVVLENRWVSSATGHQQFYQMQQGLQCYPNPFNSTTTLRFELAGMSRVTLDIKNILGQSVFKLEKALPPGQHTINFDANLLSTGTYFANLRTLRGSTVQRIILIR